MPPPALQIHYAGRARPSRARRSRCPASAGTTAARHGRWSGAGTGATCARLSHRHDDAKLTPVNARRPDDGHHGAIGLRETRRASRPARQLPPDLQQQRAPACWTSWPSCVAGRSAGPKPPPRISASPATRARRRPVNANSSTRSTTTDRRAGPDRRRTGTHPQRHLRAVQRLRRGPSRRRD